MVSLGHLSSNHQMFLAVSQISFTSFSFSELPFFHNLQYFLSTLTTKIKSPLLFIDNSLCVCLIIFRTSQHHISTLTESSLADKKKNYLWHKLLEWVMWLLTWNRRDTYHWLLLWLITYETWQFIAVHCDSDNIMSHEGSLLSWTTAVTPC